MREQIDQKPNITAAKNKIADNSKEQWEILLLDTNPVARNSLGKIW
jgi:hypothetical protein